VRPTLLGAAVVLGVLLRLALYTGDDEPEAVGGPVEAAAAGPTRSCGEGVQGRLAPNWRRLGTVVAGPLAWPYLGESYRTQPASTFASRKGRYQGQKALAVVDPGAVVRIVVPDSERGRLSLLYGSGSSEDGTNWYAVSEGTMSVTLRACRDRETQFAGGFVVAGPHCAAIDVHVRGRREPLHRLLPFGEPC
jgi:hypothetical protein